MRNGSWDVSCAFKTEQESVSLNVKQALSVSAAHHPRLHGPVHPDN